MGVCAESQLSVESELHPSPLPTRQVGSLGKGPVPDALLTRGQAPPHPTPHPLQMECQTTATHILESRDGFEDHILVSLAQRPAVPCVGLRAMVPLFGDFGLCSCRW